MHYVYILLSEKNPNKIYIGLTDDIDRRIAEHYRAKTGYAE